MGFTLSIFKKLCVKEPKQLVEIHSINELCSWLAIQEGKKVSISIGNAREVTRLLAYALQFPNVQQLMSTYGKSIVSRVKSPQGV